MTSSMAASLVLASCLTFALSANVPPVTQVATTSAAAAGAVTQQERPTGSVLDRLPILELLKDPKVVDSYTGCLLDKGPCTPDAAEVKGIMTDALTKGCPKCTPLQKQVSERLMLSYNEKQPEVFKQVTAKYDDKGEFSKKYLASLKKNLKNE